MGVVWVNEEGKKLIKKGALHVYAKNVVKADAEKGEYVEIKWENETLAYGFYNPLSGISLRVLTWEEEGVEEVIAKRMEKTYKIKSKKYGGTFRWVFGEGDLLPGLIVDLFNDVAVVKNASAGLERYLDLVYEIIKEKGVENIFVKNKGKNREKEGLNTWEGFVFGKKRETVIEEGNCLFFVDVVNGQKTGFYLDQRENRMHLEDFVDQGDRVLDLFSYTGGFGIHAAMNGADVTFVERSKKAVELLRKNLELNGLEGKVIVGDAVEELKKAQEYDVIILDPPALAKDEKDVPNAKKMYFKLNKLAAEKAKTLLVTSSCSYPITPKDFLGIIRHAMTEAGKRPIMLGGLRGQSGDHTVYLSQPETLYLKCVFLVVE